MKNNVIKTFAVALVFLSATVIFVACGSNKLTQENYDKIEIGITTYVQAKQILGKPRTDTTVDMAGIRTGAAVWQQGLKSVTLTFTDNKVMTKTSFGLS